MVDIDDLPLDFGLLRFERVYGATDVGVRLLVESHYGVDDK